MRNIFERQNALTELRDKLRDLQESNRNIYKMVLILSGLLIAIALIVIVKAKHSGCCENDDFFDFEDEDFDEEELFEDEEDFE